jgi:hypothetical protein
VVSGLLKVETSGIEPPTPSLQSDRNLVVSDSDKALTSTPSAACTAACTSEAANANAGTLDTADQGAGEGTAAIDQGDPLAVLAAELAKLSPADRERLAAMLTGHQGERGTA